MLYTEQKVIPALILLTDFEKAFDTVSFSFLRQIFKFYKFGDNVIRWIEIFYHNISSTVMVNGKPTQFFSVKRGVRQDDPCPHI